MIFIKDTSNTKLFNFKKIKNLSFILFIFFINFCLCNFACANSNTYTVMLPQKTDGIEKIEYLIDDMPYGSTAGVPSLELSKEVKLNFSVQFASSGYSQTKVKDVKIISNNSEPATLNTYGYDENGNITTFSPGDEDTIDPSQTYISSSIFVSSDDAFSFSSIESDKYNLIINLSDSNEFIGEALKVKYQYSNEEFSYASIDFESNTLKIPNINLNSSLKLWFDPTLAYSNSDINVYKSDEKLTPNENDKSFDVYVDNSDVYIQVSGVKKNQYNLKFDSSDNTSFKFKNINSDLDFSTYNENPIVVNYGESYRFTCESPDLNETHEVTVNNNVIRPENGVYSLNNISENLTVSLTEKNSAFYNISLENISEFLDITDTQNNPISEGKVKYSDPFKFKASAKEAYTQKENTILIHSVPASIASSENLNEQLENYLLTPSLEGIYTTPAVTEPMVMIATNVTKNSYQVTLPEKIPGASYTVTENENVIALSKNQFKVTHGESLEISLTAQVGYDLTDAELITDNKSAQISKNGKIHLLKNITKDTYFVVHGIKAAKCKVTFDSKGFTFKNLNNLVIDPTDTSLDYDSEKLKFQIEVSEGYELKSPLNVSISDGEGTLTTPSEEENYYTLANVHSDIKLSVTGAEPISLTVTIANDNENLEFKSVESDNKILPAQNTVKYGESFTFQVIDKNNEKPINLNINSSTGSEPIKISENPLTYKLNEISKETELTVLQNSEDQPAIQEDQPTEEDTEKEEEPEKIVYLPAKIMRVDGNNDEDTSQYMSVDPKGDVCKFCDPDKFTENQKHDRFVFNIEDFYDNTITKNTDDNQTNNESQNNNKSQNTSFTKKALDEPVEFVLLGLFPYKLKRINRYVISGHKTQKDYNNQTNAVILANRDYYFHMEYKPTATEGVSYEKFCFDKSYFNKNYKEMLDYAKWVGQEDNGRLRKDQDTKTWYVYENYALTLKIDAYLTFEYKFEFNDPIDKNNHNQIFYEAGYTPIEYSKITNWTSKGLIYTIKKEYDYDKESLMYNPHYFTALFNAGFSNFEGFDINYELGKDDNNQQKKDDILKEYWKLNVTYKGEVANTPNRYFYSNNVGYNKRGKLSEEKMKQFIQAIQDFDAKGRVIKLTPLGKKTEYNVTFSNSIGTKFKNDKDGEILKKTVEYDNDLSFYTLPITNRIENQEYYAEIKSENQSYIIDLTTSIGEPINNCENIPIDKLTISKKAENSLEYKIEGIKGNLDIIIKRKLIQNTVCFPTNTNGITLKRKINLEEINSEISTSNTSFSFFIEVDDGYDISNIKVKGKVKNTSIDTVKDIYYKNGYYTVHFNEFFNDGSSDRTVTIEISGIKINTYKVTFNSYEDLTYKGPSGQVISNSLEFKYGENVSFSASVSNSGPYSNSNITVKAENSSSGEITELKLDKKSNLYTINNIQNNYRIFVEGLKLNEYNLRFKSSESINYYDQYGVKKLTSEEQNSEFIIQKVNYGETFGFKVLPNEGVDLSEINVYYAQSSSSTQSSKKLLPVDDVYYIENITTDIIIHVEDTKSINYQVEIRTTEGVKCLDSFGNVLNSKISVDYGGGVSFTLSLDPAYNNASPIVSVKGSTNVLSPSASGIYTLENIKENKIIEVTNVTKNTYRIKFKETEGVIYRTVKNKDFTEYLDAEYGDVQQFKISLMDAYDQSTPIVLLNNSKVLNANGGIYTIENVEANLEVTVENVVKNPEETTMEDINDVPESIISSADVDKIVEATKTYESLPEEQKILVTNTSGLTAAQEEAKTVNHNSNDVTVTGIDWNIKLIVTPLTDDKEAMDSLNSEIDRRTLLSLHEMKLINLLTNEYYEVPYGQEVSVTMPCSNLDGYENIVVVHKNSGGGIEYLDVNINDNTASFKTSSFSQFGLAGKKIPNYSENPSDLKISVSDLVENEDELKNLLGEGLTSQLGELINLEDNQSEMNTNSNDNLSPSSSSETQNSEHSIEKIYRWATNNEFLSVIIILALGLLIILLILFVGRKKKEE